MKIGKRLFLVFGLLVALMAGAAGVAKPAQGFQAALGYGSAEYAPPRHGLERLAKLATFRI